MECPTISSMLTTILAISYIMQSASAACPSNCPVQEQDVCNLCNCAQNPDNSMVFNCKGKGLTQVPTFITTSIEYHEVTLAQNSITSIPAEKFKDLQAVKKLDLTDNQISSIVAGAFRGLDDSLEELRLEVNGMTSFPKGPLSVLSNLRLLSATGFNMSSSGLPNGAFESLNKLQVLDLQSNGIRSLTAESMSGQHDNFIELNVDHNQITAIPTVTLSYLTNLESFSILANQIHNIGPNAFQGSNIETLDLTQNGFNSLHANAFSGLESRLRTLTMRSCQLHDSMLPSLKELHSLTDLELSENSMLANIPNNQFSWMSQLVSLNLYNCGLHTVRRETFAGLSSLTNLDLGDNALTSVAADTFAATPKLADLNLASNTNLASNLPSNVFQPVTSTLKVLSVENTGFSDAHWSMVQDLSNLKSIHLTNNQIQTLPDMGFANFKFLEAAHLDNNDITEVTQKGLFGPNDYLKSIDFNQNRIQTILECAFFEFTQFEEYLLNLNNNPLHCDCQMSWLLERLQQHDNYDFLKQTLEWTCDTPPNHANKKFARDLALGDLTCDPPMTFAPCLDISPTIPPSPSIIPTSETSTENPYYFKINITDVTDVSLMIFWEIGNTEGVTGFRVSHKELPDGEDEYDEFSSTMRSSVIDDLTPATDYYVCVQVLGVDWPVTTACSDATTLPPTGGVKTGGNNTTTIALSCCLGALVIIAIIIILVILKRKKKPKKQPTENGYQNNALGVRVGGESKRFSKPRSQNDIRDTVYFQNGDNAAFEHKLDGFSVDERNRILGLISQNGASTLSMISNASGQRYRELPEPPGATGGRVAYLNPVDVNDDLDKHVYCEIPGESNYNEIPDSFI